MPGTTHTTVAFHVPGTPEPQRRPRAHRHGAHARVHDDPRNRTYADTIRWAWRDSGGHQITQGPIHLVITAIWPRPKSHLTTRGQLNAAGRRATHPTQTDLSNVVKAVEDAMNGCGWTDDRQVTRITARKQWAAPGRGVGVHVLATTDRRLEART